jgi:DNA polymerase
MHVITLDSPTDFDGWRQTARRLALNAVAPADVTWHLRGDAAELFGSAAATQPLDDRPGSFNVSAKFIELAKSAILHRDNARFALLYRLLWRLRNHRDLIAVATDPDVAEIAAMARAVRRDLHKMHAFVRFREVAEEPDLTGEKRSRFVAWFEPEHHIAEAAAPFFARRFAEMAWSILTPERCVHWDRHAIFFSAGATKLDAPSGDRLEAVWRQYYASIFNPARLKVKAMQAEMPKKYWRNLPEAALIKPLIEAAVPRTEDMIAHAISEPHKAQKKPEALTNASLSTATTASTDAIAGLRDAARHCRACPLWKDATQTVFGEGRHNARMMLVGEQPGDKEDLAGVPFVGPAGEVLDRALREAGIDRGTVYLTNAVKHFKFVPRGKIRLHQKPATPEIKACLPWYQRELAVIKPDLVVAMGATAAQCVLGKVTPIQKNRGQPITLDEGRKALVTVHPSYLLRLPDADARAQEYARFVADLKLAAELVEEIRNCAHTF